MQSFLTTGDCLEQTDLINNDMGHLFIAIPGLTSFVLIMVNPVVIVIIILVSDCSMKASVRVRVRLTVVDSVEVVLAVEDASALAGQCGHAQPAESPGQARWFLLAKGRRPPFPSHPLSGTGNLTRPDVCLTWTNNPQV